MIRMLNQKYGTTILITSHDISDIEKLCNRIILINHGKIIVDNALDIFMRNWATKKRLVATTDDDISLAELQNAFSINEAKVDIDGSIIVEYDEVIINSATVRSKLSALGNFQNITVTNASLEDIIYDIYTNKRGDYNA
jgi:ABC-2 type transport system ATP-binding protein